MRKYLGRGLLCGTLLLAGTVQADTSQDGAENNGRLQWSDQPYAVEATPSSASHKSFSGYVGISVGATKSTYLSDEAKGTIQSLDPDMQVTSDEGDASTKIYLGVTVSPNVDFRVSYADLGKYTSPLTVYLPKSA